MSVTAAARQSAWLPSVIGALAIAVPIAAQADNLPQGWSGKGQAGYVMSRGDSDTDAANVKVDLNLVSQDWKQTLSLDGLFGRSAGITSAERWDARLQSDYSINKRLFTFGALAYQDDRFSGFVYQASASGGLGYKFFDSDTTKLSAQAGVGYRNLRTEFLLKDPNTGAVSRRIPLQTQSEVVETSGIDFMHQFNASTKVIDKFNSESGASNTSIRNDLSLEVKMNKKLSLATGYSVLHNTAPAVGVKKTNTTTTLNLVYAFPDRK
jgi:putative salt-induced outer membrane protein